MHRDGDINKGLCIVSKNYARQWPECGTAAAGGGSLSLSLPPPPVCTCGFFLCRNRHVRTVWTCGDRFVASPPVPAQPPDSGSPAGPARPCPPPPRLTGSRPRRLRGRKMAAAAPPVGPSRNGGRPGARRGRPPAAAGGAGSSREEFLAPPGPAGAVERARPPAPTWGCRREQAALPAPCRSQGRGRVGSLRPAPARLPRAPWPSPGSPPGPGCEAKGAGEGAEGPEVCAFLFPGKP